MRPGRSTLLRYVLAQVPGWVGLAVILLVARAGLDVAWWILGAVAAAWVIKDAALYPIVRRAYEPGDGEASRRLVGARCTAVRTLDPAGWVRLGGELWRAEVDPGSPAADPGTALRVREVRGLVLHVEPWDGPSAS